MTERDPVRVLHLNPAFKLDGPGRGILALIRHLPGDRVRSEACSLSPADPAMERLLREHGIPHICLGMRGCWDIRAIPRLARTLRQKRIEVLHTNLSRADWVGRVAGRMARTPVVVSSIRNLHREMYRAEYGRLVASLAPRLDRWTGRWVDAFIAVSEDVRARLVSEEYSSDRITLIPNSVDLEALGGLRHDPQRKQRLLKLPQDSLVIGTVALFKVQKGHTYLIEAAARIRQEWPRAYFLLVGSGPEASVIHRRIVASGLESAFVCVGQQADVLPYLETMDIFVLPSLWEGMPRALMEAMAAGIPAVGTDVSGIRDLIQDGVTGLLVPPRDPSSLAKAVSALLANPTWRQEMGSAGRRCIRERHDAAVSACRHAELYANLLAGRGGAHSADWQQDKRGGIRR